MKLSSEIILGIDICNETSQLSFFDENAQQPESIPLKGTEVILKNPVSIHEILETMQEGVPVLLEELTKLIAYLIETAKKYTKQNNISYICVTVDDFTILILDSIKQAFINLGFPLDKLSFISHDESCAYYAYSMKKELWNGGILLLDYNELGLQSSLYVNRKINDKEVIIEDCSYFQDEEILHVIKGDKVLNEIEEYLINICKQVMNGKIISSIYLTGKGFDTATFPDGFIQFICNKHKVFAGQNLYVKGACIAAYEELTHNQFANMLFACKNRVTTGIEMGILERGKNKMLRIVKAGTNWYQSSRTMNFIVDDYNELKLCMIPITAKDQYEEVINFSEFPYREGKTTRIQVEFKFTADDRCFVTVKDKGFGEIAKSSGKVIYKELKL